MTASFLEDRTRNVIPRWRDFRTTLALGEITTGRPHGASVEHAREAGDFLDPILSAWQENRSAAFASDLISNAFVLGRGHLPEVKEAAEFIMRTHSGSSAAARALAGRVLGISEDVEYNRNEPDPLDEKKLRRLVRELRSRSHAYPHDALLWADLALYYTSLGVSAQASKCMRVALALAPEERFILRSAARLEIHLGDLDRAHDLLRWAEHTSRDPWLMAAEISVSTAAGRSSRLIGAARSMVESKNVSPFDSAELASALGTVELRAGALRRARRLIRYSLVSPTENAVAQAAWTERRGLEVEVPDETLATPRSFEARAWTNYSEGKLELAFLAARSWLSDQPFSTRPSLMASSLAGGVLENYEECERIARIGLIANPSEPGLMNNLGFALAQLGRIEEAEKVLSALEPSRAARETQIALLATEGLVAYRRGDAEKGRVLYQEAIQGAEQANYSHLAAMAAAYAALEARRAGEEYEQLIESARRKSLETRVPELSFLLARLERNEQ